MEYLQSHSSGVLPVELDAAGHQGVSNSNHATTIDPHTSIDSILQILKNYQPTNIPQTSPHDLKSHTQASGPVKSSYIYDNEYSDYSPEYGYWDSTGGIDWNGSNANSDGPLPSSTDAPESTLLNTSVGKTDGSGETVGVTFNGTTSDGKNGDQPVTQI